MGISDWIRKNKGKDTGKDIKPITNFGKVPNGSVIVAQSEIPEWCSIGNLIFDKKYNEAIELGKILLAKYPNSAGVHINLMDVYFKTRSENPEYFELSTYHAKQAMFYGHNTGFAQKRLVINLEKQNKIHQAIQLCDIILSPKYNFSSHGGGSKNDFAKRKELLLKKIAKSTDLDSDYLFSSEEINTIYNEIKLSNKLEEQQHLESKAFIENLKKHL